MLGEVQRQQYLQAQTQSRERTPTIGTWEGRNVRSLVQPCKETSLKGFRPMRLVLFAICLLLTSGAAMHASIRFQNTDSWKVEVTVSNPFPHAVHLLVWESPFDELLGAARFTVSRNGTAVIFMGPVAKRGDPSISSYLEFTAGQSRVAVVDLSEDFDLSEPGNYHIALQHRWRDFSTDRSTIPKPRHAHTPLDPIMVSNTIERTLHSSIPQSGDQQR